MLADRDFDIGVPIDENLKSKMERSKRILLIITPSFVKSFWCKEEIMRAIKIMSSGNNNLMIPVLLKPVETEMPSFLEFYTYIDATKEDDLSLKIFETFHNPIFPLTPEQIRNQNGARLMSRLCKKANTSCRGVAWSFPPIDDMAYEQEDILQIYNEVKDILNDSFAFRWYGIMFNTRRQSFAAVERKVFDYCLKERKGSSVIAFVKDARINARCLARPTSVSFP
ncbi:hypothetical protein FSP39_020651 [Pinctada imbricata]|uniref:TIR domain-containing protein n=1 Tax=Pinctada imbricata TaxID=66713 RepID=A0AA89C5Q9_PINIB|nr:hypothetical protein FSP39_020651 [Pinctada imbricata]